MGGGLRSAAFLFSAPLQAELCVFDVEPPGPDTLSMVQIPRSRFRPVPLLRANDHLRDVATKRGDYAVRG